MILSFSRQFLFIAIPKTATHSLRAVLRPHLGPRDWEQCTLFEKRYLPLPPLAQLDHGHLTCAELRPFLIPGVFESLFKFATVRNPFDRLVSSCAFRWRDDEALRRDLGGRIKQLLAEPVNDRHLRPQTDFIAADGVLLMDDICHVESLECDVARVCERIGVVPGPLPRINPSAHPHWATCFDEELRQQAVDYYRTDFELLGYSTRIPEVAG